MFLLFALVQVPMILTVYHSPGAEYRISWIAEIGA